MTTATDVEVVDLATTPLRELNQRLHDGAAGGPLRWRIVNPNGAHAVAVGVDAPFEIEIEGHTGYYTAGMNKHAHVRVNGNVGVGCGENIMSGSIHITGNASQACAATGRGGLVIVKGSIGHMSAFMAQSGALVVCGDAGDSLGDSIYETHIYVRGSVEGLGADCIEKELKEFHREELGRLLTAAGADAKVDEFKRYGSARRLYNFNIDHAGEY